MYDTSQFRRGLKIEIDNVPYTIVFFQHVKPGKGNQFTRTKMKNLFTGLVIERTYRSGEKVGIPDLEFQDCSFLYQDGDTFHFMNQTTYEQFEIGREKLGDTTKYLIPDLSVQLMFYRGRTANIELPTFVDLLVSQSDPGVKGDTASGGTKPATLETGLVVYVPFHINEGDVLKIDTRSGDYVERVKRG
jgi:elongation factor P